MSKVSFVRHNYMHPRAWTH